MKKVIFIFLLIASSFTSNAQNAKQDKDGNFVAIAAATIPAKDTGKTFTDKDGKKYPVYVSAKGKYFVNVVSKQSGKAYKKYLVL